MLVALFWFNLVSLTLASNWSTYPSVSKTASINGFADPIYSSLPSCAKDCVKQNVKLTPCPYWDTGCFCVMPNWSGLVAACFASKCHGSDIDTATSLAISLCDKVGADTWMIPASASTALLTAEKNGAVASTSATTTAETTSTESLASVTETSTTSSGTSSSVTVTLNAATTTTSVSSSATASNLNNSTSGTSSANVGTLLNSSIVSILFIYAVSMLF